MKVTRTRYVGRLGSLTLPRAADPHWGLKLNTYYKDDPTRPTEYLGVALHFGGGPRRRYVSWVWPITIARAASGEGDRG